jgi:phenylpropionate dioxygenase-like ring-hydroxylating dioxygenase large terminal subunit
MDLILSDSSVVAPRRTGVPVATERARRPSTLAVVVVDSGEDSLLGQTIASVPRVLQPFRVPAARYTSPGWAELEHARLWPHVWQIAGTVDHVAEPGDWFEYQVGWLSVVVVRTGDGGLRAYQNVCRHRGNVLACGEGRGRTELRCDYHRWCWDLEGRLREVPSRRGFGTLRNEELGLVEVRVAEWAPLVFVNLDLEADPLEEFLEVLPVDAPWLGLADFHCTYDVAMPMPCNWKTLIDGFSETYHVQGLHREMLPMTDDVNSPQRLWGRHGKLEQPYGLASPRLRHGATDQEIYDAFVEVMGTRIGKPTTEPAGPVPEAPPGHTLRDVLADGVRETAAASGVDLSHHTTDQLMTMQQYNLFPNATMVAFPDLLQVVKSRPGPTPDECIMDTLVFERRPSGAAPAPPVRVTVEPGDIDYGMVINQDVDALRRIQRGLHQPGCTHLVLSGEECRIVNLHRNLEEMLGIEPSEITGG